MSETTTAPSIPENALPSEPDYVLKKKFNPATIPAIISLFPTAFMAIGMIVTGIISLTKSFFPNSWIYLESGIEFSIQFIAMFLLCILMFIRLNKPFMCAPLFVSAFSFMFSLVNAILSVQNQEEFKATFYSEDNFMEYYSYSDYMILRALYWIFLATMILSFVAAGVYVILASNEKTNGKVRKLWFIPAIVFALSAVMYIVYAVVSFALFYFSNVLSGITTMLIELAHYTPQILTVILLCKWISNPYKKVLKKDIEEAEKKKAEKKAQKEMSQKPVQAAKPSQPAPPKPAAPTPQPKPVSAAQKTASTVAPPPIRPVAPVQSRPAPMQSPASAPVPSNQVSTMAQKNNIELIKQYKELLDMGAISQEEYEEKKKKLLTD